MFACGWPFLIGVRRENGHPLQGRQNNLSLPYGQNQSNRLRLPVVVQFESRQEKNVGKRGF